MRIESDNAAVVARKASGTQINATVADGTRTPPTPNPEIVPIATASFGVSGVAADNAPPNAVMRMVATRRIWLALNDCTDNRALKITAPTVTDTP